MGLNANKIPAQKKESKFPPAEALEADSYPGRVVRILDLGVQPQRPFTKNGVTTEKPPVHQIDVTYELVTEFMKDEDGEPDLTKPRWVSESFPFYSLEAELAKSTKRYNTIDPKGLAGGDFTQLVGMPCVVTLNQYKKKDGNITNGISAVTPIMKGLVVDELVNETKVFTLDEPDLDVFRSLPQWLQDKIKSNLEFKGSVFEEALSNAPADGEKAKEEPKAKKEAPAKKEEPANDQQDDGEDAPW